MSTPAPVGHPKRLHIGCGTVRLEGYINTDLIARDGAEALDIRDLGRRFKPDSLTEILAIQCITHLYPWEAVRFFEDAFKVLKSRGQLIMEMVNVKQCAQWLVDHEAEMGEVARCGIYGCGQDHLVEKRPYQATLSGWTPRSIILALKAVGFVPEVLPAQTHWPERDMRVVGTKP